MNFETIKISELKPAPYNPRIMRPSEQLKLKRGLETFGLIDPIIIDLKHDNTIIGGHQRHEVLTSIDEDMKLKLLKMGDIGLVFHETEFQVKDINDQKAMNLSLNKITGEFDMSLVDEIIEDMAEENYDILLTGFDEDELLDDSNMFDTDLDLLDELVEDDEVNDELLDDDKVHREDVIPLKKVDTIINEGDKYQLGDHVLFCADSTCLDNIHDLIGDERVDLLLTDPPYGINIIPVRNKGEREHCN